MQSEAPFIVFGPSKSGTTWLQRSLDAIPGISCKFQIPLFPFTSEEIAEISGDKKNRLFKLHHNSPFKGLFNDPEAEIEYLAKNKLLRRIPLNQTGYLDQYIDPQYQEPQKKIIYGLQKAVAKYILSQDSGEVQQLTGVKAYTNLSNYFKVFPEGRVVVITRDIRDTVVSKRFHNLRAGNFFSHDLKLGIDRMVVELNTRVWLRMNEVIKREPQVYSKDELVERGLIVTPKVIDAFAGDWIGVMRHVTPYLEDDRVLLVRYEELKLTYKNKLMEVLDFLGYQGDFVVKDLAAPSMNKGDDSFFRKGEFGDWKNYFSQSNLDYLDHKAGELGRRFQFN